MNKKENEQVNAIMKEEIARITEIIDTIKAVHGSDTAAFILMCSATNLAVVQFSLAMRASGTPDKLIESLEGNIAMTIPAVINFGIHHSVGQQNKQKGIQIGKSIKTLSREMVNMVEKINGVRKKPNND